MRWILHTIGFGCALLGLCVCGAVADPAPPFADPPINGHPLLSTWLENQMQDMTSTCTGNGPTLHMEGHRPVLGSYDAGPVTAIPSYIQTALNFSSKPVVAPGSDTTLTREFGYVFTSEAEQSQTARDPSFYVDLDYGNYDDQRLQPGITGRSYTATCASTLKAGLDANAGFTFPIAAIKGALSADYSDSATYRLTLVSGTFVNPLLDMYHGRVADGGSKSGEEFFAAVTIWDWYVNHPEKVSSTNSMLHDFKGISVYKQSTIKQDLTGNANVTLGLSSVVANANAQVSGQIQSGTQFSGESFSNAADMDSAGTKDTRHFEKLPTISDVINHDTKEHLVLDSTLSDKPNWLDVTTKKKIVETISYLPVGYCDNGAWSIDNAQIKFAMPAISGSDATKAPVCTFTFLYTPPVDAQFVDQDVSGNLVDQFVDGAGTVRKFSVALDSYGLIANTSPNLEWLNGSPIPNPSNGVTIIWNLLYKLNDDANAISDIGDMDFSHVDFQSGCGQLAAATITPTLQKNGGTKNVQLVISEPFGGPLPDASHPGGYNSCQLRGKVIFTVGGAPVSREFPTITLQYPVAGH